MKNMFKNIFKRIFGRKRHVAIDCETQGLDGSSPISINDAKWLLNETKKDYNTLTQILNSMPAHHPDDDEVKPEERQHYQGLWDWNVRARTRHYDIGIDIENLERIMCQYIPGFEEIVPKEPLN